MITFRQFITEARMAPLYHATSTDSAALILKTGVLHAKTSHRRPDRSIIKGSSFTRNYNYATYFGYHDAGHYGVIVFEVDQQKLGYRNKIVPINYWNLAKKGVSGYPDKARQSQAKPSIFLRTNNEFEEFVIGDVGSFINCVTKIIVTSERTMEDVKNHPELVDHPLLWDKTNPRSKGHWINK